MRTWTAPGRNANRQVWRDHRNRRWRCFHRNYGTDWLAFAHLTIALFFILPWRDPVRYEGVLKVGIVASLGVIPLALICGPLRGIPFWWRMIDCSFGLLCLPPLWFALRKTRALQR